LKATLAWIACAYFTVAAMVMAFYAMFKVQDHFVTVFLVAVMIFGSGLPFLVIALKQQQKSASADEGSSSI
jgi:hypothetical protein